MFVDDVSIMYFDELKKKHLRIIIFQTIIIVYQIFLLITNTLSWSNLRENPWLVNVTRARNISIMLSISLLISMVGLAIILELRINYWSKKREVVFEKLEKKYAARRKISLIIFTAGIVFLVGISAYSLYILLHYLWYVK